LDFAYADSVDLFGIFLAIGGSSYPPDPSPCVRACILILSEGIPEDEAANYVGIVTASTIPDTRHMLAGSRCYKNKKMLIFDCLTRS